MSHVKAKGADIIGAIVTALNNTTLNGGTVTVTTESGGHVAKITINTDGNGAYAQSWNLVLH